MNIVSSKPSLTNVREMILPAIQGLSEVAAKERIPIISADISLDFVYDRIQLHVTHALLGGGELYDGDWKRDIGPRLRSAMTLFHRMPEAKALCVDRRRLFARGERAAKNKKVPRRTR